MPEERAINPYNFIPFGTGPERHKLEDYYNKELLSGWFDVKLTVNEKNPLIIPDGAAYNLDPEVKDHKIYTFFRLPDGTPAIPGSSLRGMIRSVYEAATDSCLPFLLKDSEYPISQRTPLYASFQDRGLLRHDKELRKWKLYSTYATKIKTTPEEQAEIKTGRFRGFTNGQHVMFHKKSDGTVCIGSGDRNGYLQFNVPVSFDNYSVAILEEKEVLFEERESVKREKTEDTMYRSLNTSIYDTLRNTRKFKLATTQWDLQEALNMAARESGAVPCYYFIVERNGAKLVYLSGAAVGRVRQKRKWPDIMGQHAPCNYLDELCPACALFGNHQARKKEDRKIAKGKKRVKDAGTAGRLHFSDAKAEAYEMAEDPVTLPILSTPRTSSFEFYLRKPNKDATYWNFDYYGEKCSYVNKNGKTVTYTEYHDLPEATPRGRKMYWHGEPQTDTKRPKLNATMEVMKKGTFTYRVTFDRITEEQLGDLLWVITLGENRETSKFKHKLGHGKPVGYGSVKMTVFNLTIRKIDAKNGFSVSLESPNPEEYIDKGIIQKESEQVRALLRMADFDATKGKKVEYLTGADGKIYSWFGANRVNSDDVLTLPEPTMETAEELTLPTKRAKRSAGVSQTPEQRYPAGMEFLNAQVISIKGPHVKFQLPNCQLSGHYYKKYYDDIIEGDYWDVRVKWYDKKFNQLEVEVLWD